MINLQFQEQTLKKCVLDLRAVISLLSYLSFYKLNKHSFQLGMAPNWYF